jgi:hypothetical protein
MFSSEIDPKNFFDFLSHLSSLIFLFSLFDIPFSFAIRFSSHTHCLNNLFTFLFSKKKRVRKNILKNEMESINSASNRILMNSIIFYFLYKEKFF